VELLRCTSTGTVSLHQAWRRSPPVVSVLRSVPARPWGGAERNALRSRRLTVPSSSLLAGGEGAGPLARAGGPRLLSASSCWRSVRRERAARDPFDDALP